MKLFSGNLFLRRCALFAIVALTPLYQISFAQDTASIQGIVTDRKSGGPLLNVDITLLNTNFGDVSDSTGSYRIGSLSAGKYSVRASRIGFEIQVVTDILVQHGETRTISFSLVPRPIRLEEVTVEAEHLWHNYVTEASLVGVKRMRAEEITTTPAAFDDAFRAIQIKSGVTGAGDYSGYFSVRGGSVNQNLVVMDGVTIPNPYRFRAALGAGFSDINPSTIRDLHLHLGGYSARFGNALSSVLEIQSRTGNSRRFSGQASLNVTDMSALIEGPLPPQGGSYLFSLRRTYYDILANRLVGGDSSFPFFFEIMGKVVYPAANRHRLILSFKRSREGTDLLDDLSRELNLSQSGSTYLGSLTWHAFFSEKLQARTILSYYDDQTEFRAFKPDSNLVNQNRQNLDTKSKNVSFREDVRYRISGTSWLDFGAAATVIPSKVDFISIEGDFLYARTEFPNQIDFDRTYQHYAVYVENSSKLTSKVHLRMGARYDHSTLIHEGALGPRFSIWYQVDDRTAIEGSWGITYQFADPMDIYTRDPPVDLSQNLNIISPEKATHQVVGLTRSLKTDMEARIELYNKDLDRLLLPQDDVFFAPQNSGYGVARGIEVRLEKRRSQGGRLSGFVSYAFSESKYRHDDGSKWIPFKFDRRHSMTFFANLRLAGSWRANLLWQAASGLPFTDVVGFRVNSFGDWRFVSGPRNEANFPLFHRLDARLSYRHRSNNREWSFYLDFINLTNHKNVYEIIWERSFVEQSGQTVRAANKRTFFMLPFVPSFGLSVKL